MTVVAEVGDFARFGNPRQLMAYLAENRSGVVCVDRRAGMGKLCRWDLTAATARLRYAADIFLEAISLKICPEGSSLAVRPVWCCHR